MLVDALDFDEYDRPIGHQPSTLRLPLGKVMISRIIEKPFLTTSISLSDFIIYNFKNFCILLLHKFWAYAVLDPLSVLLAWSGLFSAISAVCFPPLPVSPCWALNCTINPVGYFLHMDLNSPGLLPRTSSSTVDPERKSGDFQLSVPSRGHLLGPHQLKQICDPIEELMWVCDSSAIAETMKTICLWLCTQFPLLQIMAGMSLPWKLLSIVD